jgi:acyl-CoA reductase-like NAD-dependent aldehyde dehydrogenase
MKADMLLSREKTFGPVAAIYSFDTEDEAIKMANGSLTFSMADISHVCFSAAPSTRAFVLCSEFG